MESISHNAYAQTNIQLWNQLKEHGYSNQEVVQISKGYELAISLYSGYFIGSGRTQIAHVVGTASMLSSLRVPGAVVTAGLIHNAYANGDFGACMKGPTTHKRRQIIQAVGPEVEKYVYGFHALTFRGNKLATVLSDIATADSVTRVGVLIILAERLEHRLNDGGLKQYTKYVDENGPLMVEAALKLGFPLLADRLRAIINVPATGDIIGEMITSISSNKSRWIPPASCRRRFAVIARLAVTAGCRLLSRNPTVSRMVRRARSVRAFN